MHDERSTFPRENEYGRRGSERIADLLVEMEGMIETLKKERFRTAIQQAAGLMVSILGVAVLVGMVPEIELEQMGFVAMTVFFAITGVAYGFRILLEAMELGSSKSKEMDRWTARYIAASISDMEEVLCEIGGWDMLDRRTKVRTEKLFTGFQRALPDWVLQEEMSREREVVDDRPIRNEVRNGIDALLRLPE